MKKVLGIGGSPREGGSSDILQEHLLKGIRNGGATTEGIHLRDYHILPCTACMRCRNNRVCVGIRDGMQLIYPKIYETRGLVLVSPIYSYSVTAQMKAFIDRLCCLYEDDKKRPGGYYSHLEGQGRKALIAAVGRQNDRDFGGIDLTLKVMRRSIQAMGYELIGELPVTGMVRKAEVRRHPDVLDQAEILGRELASSLA
jgi:multimeric flavodoxin WrbA